MSMKQHKRCCGRGDVVAGIGGAVAAAAWPSSADVAAAQAALERLCAPVAEPPRSAATIKDLREAVKGVERAHQRRSRATVRAARTPDPTASATATQRRSYYVPTIDEAPDCGPEMEF